MGPHDVFWARSEFRAGTPENIPNQAMALLVRIGGRGTSHFGP